MSIKIIDNYKLHRHYFVAAIEYKTYITNLRVRNVEMINLISNW